LPHRASDQQATSTPVAAQALASAPTDKQRARGARSHLLVVGSIGVVLVLGIVVALGNGWLDSPAPPAQNFANLTVAPSPDPTSWQGIALDCTPLPYVNHHFPNEYKGHVYVQLAASTSAAVDATILIKWVAKGYSNT
jgi:hypothetical protein